MKAPGPMKRSELHEAITERASEFYERRHFAKWSDGDQAELDAWLAESALNRVAYLRLEGAAAYTEHLATVHTFKVGAGTLRSSAGGRGKFRYRWFVLPLLAAACAALFAALGMPLIDSLLEPPVRSLSTDVGGRTLLRFVDGTEFELNTDSAIHYRMTNRERMVWLDRGEVWFHVAHDPKNPFAVVIGKHRVADLGTDFFVRRDSNRIEVALLKGGAALGTEGVQTVTLRPGDDAVATRVSVSVTRKTPQELADKLAWRRGVLVFRNAKLADVVREFNRYNATKLAIADPSLDGLKITTDLRTDDLDGFVQLTRDVLRLKVNREGNEILFSRAAMKAKGTKAADAP